MARYRFIKIAYWDLREQIRVHYASDHVESNCEIRIKQGLRYKSLRTFYISQIHFNGNIFGNKYELSVPVTTWNQIACHDRQMVKIIRYQIA